MLQLHPELCQGIAAGMAHMPRIIDKSERQGSRRRRSCIKEVHPGYMPEE